MRDMIPIAEHVQLRRDRRSGAVVDVDSTSYENYLKIKNSRQQQQERIGAMETRINNMEADIADIKTLLYKLLEK
jgi:hypothetical protein